MCRKKTEVLTTRSKHTVQNHQRAKHGFFGTQYSQNIPMQLGFP